MSRLCAIVGTPSPLLYSVVDVVRGFIQVASGDHDVITANSMAELKDRYPRQDAALRKPVILVADYPQDDLLRTLAAVQASVVVVIDGFRSIALASVLSRGLSPLESMRFASLGIASLESAITSREFRALMIKSGMWPVRLTVEALGRLYDLPADPEVVEKALDYLGVPSGGDHDLEFLVSRNAPAEIEVRRATEACDPLEGDLAELLAKQYDALILGGELNELEWPPYALMRPDAPNRVHDASIDLVGPARYILYGPYFGLTAGLWRASITIETRDSASGNELIVDAFSGRRLGLRKLVLPANGVHEFDLDFGPLSRASSVEIRFLLSSGAIDGQFLVRRIRLARQKAHFTAAAS